MRGSPKYAKPEFGATYAVPLFPRFSCLTRPYKNVDYSSTTSTTSLADQHDQTQITRAKVVIRQDGGGSIRKDTAIWSPRPLRRRVLSTKSLASACPDAGSSGRSLMLVSVGSPWRQKPLRPNFPMNQQAEISPGTIDQWSNTCRQNACPCVAVRKSVSNPLASITGIKALMV
jgi:hypothetical protein